MMTFRKKSFDVFLAILKRQSTRTSRGRQKNDYNRQFEHLLKLVESGASDILDTVDVEMNCLYILSDYRFNDSIINNNLTEDNNTLT